MASYLPPSHLSKYLPHILSPVYRVSEDDITRDAHMETLKILTAELTTLLQARVGVPAFAAAYSTIRQRIATTRLERKTKRAVQTAVNPIAAAKRKKRPTSGGAETPRPAPLWVPHPRRVCGFASSMAIAVALPPTM